MPSRRSASRPQHTVAVPEERWRRTGELAAEQATDRTALINDWFAWYCREPAAKLPKRPPRGPTT